MSKLCGLSMERMWQKLGIVDEKGSNLCHAKEMLCFRHPRETIAASGGTAVGGGEELRKKSRLGPRESARRRRPSIFSLDLQTHKNNCRRTNT
jgi:hypothetical protein